LGESVFPLQIKGEFLEPEKSFIIDLSKINMMWKCVHDYMNKYREKLKIGRDNSTVKSDIVYPKLEDSLKVIFL
jgi:hypothetical protein